MKKEEIKNIAPNLSALKLKQKPFILPDGALNDVENSVLAALLESKLKSKIGIQNPFKVHENYFENFEDSIIDSLENQLHKSVKSTLKVPENYFENFEQKVLSNLKNTTENKEVKAISLRSRIIKISATIAVAASLGLFFIFNQQQNDDLSFDSLALSEIEEWINQDKLDLDAYQIAAVYTETKLQPNLLNASINEDELEEFLKNENINELLYE